MDHRRPPPLHRSSVAARALLLVAVAALACRTAPSASSDPRVAAAVTATLEAAATVGYGGKAYCDHWVLREERARGAVALCVWAYCQEYQRRDEAVRKGSGSSGPREIVLDVSDPARGPRVVSNRSPRDGSLYSADLATMPTCRGIDHPTNERLAFSEASLQKRAGVRP
jgi:hypothetical protein